MFNADRDYRAILSQAKRNKYKGKYYVLNTFLLLIQTKHYWNYIGMEWIQSNSYSCVDYVWLLKMQNLNCVYF